MKRRGRFLIILGCLAVLSFSIFLISQATESRRTLTSANMMSQRRQIPASMRLKSRHMSSIRAQKVPGMSSKGLYTQKALPINRNLTAPIPQASKVTAKKPDGSCYREGEVLVRFKKGIKAQAIDEMLSTKKLNKKKKFPVLSRLKGKEYMLVKGNGREAAELRDMLKQDPRVESAALNYAGQFFNTCEGNIPNDELFDFQWPLCNIGQQIYCFGPDPEDCVYGIPDADIDATEAWDYQTGSRDIVVVVADTGVAYNHPDLANNMWINTAEAEGISGVDDDRNGYIDDIYGIDTGEDDSDPADVMGHGTAVAGLIAAEGNNNEGIAGVNWETRIMAIKLATADFGLYVSDVIDAIEYILSWKEAGEHIIAMNASWGFIPEFEDPEDMGLLKDAIEELGRGGIILVAAAANYGENNDDGSFDPVPASFDLPNIIAVAATDWNDDLTFWSNYGPISVDLGAPGDLLMSTSFSDWYEPGLGDDIFFDDMESGSGNWLAEGTWQITNENFYSPHNAWSDSPYDNYQDNTFYALTTKPIDLSGESGPLTLGFAIQFEMEEDWEDSLDIFFKVQKPSFWEKTIEKAHESIYAWSDSPNGNYPDYAYSWLVSPTIDLSGADNETELTFWLTGEVEEGFDNLLVFFSADGGENWDIEEFVTGNWSDQWYLFPVDIPLRYRTSQFQLAFVLESDFIITADGYYIDDVVIQDSSTIFFNDDMETDTYTWSQPTLENWDYMYSFTGFSDGWWVMNIPLYEGCYWNEFQVKFATNYGDEINYDGIYLDNVGIGTPESLYDYDLFGGTSGSAPLVTGALALLAAQYPEEGPDTLIQRILLGVDKVPSLDGKVATGGRLNLYNSLQITFNEPPDCTHAYPSIEELWPPNHKMVAVNILGISDPDGDPVNITITGITSDEPTASAKGSGGHKHSPDADGVGTDTALLRAERSGKGNGRVYEISFIASDPDGAECSGSVTVCVPHDQRPGHECVDDGQVYDATKVN